MIGESLLLKMAKDLELDTAYMSHTLSDNRHPVSFEQGALLIGLKNGGVQRSPRYLV